MSGATQLLLSPQPPQNTAPQTRSGGTSTISAKRQLAAFPADILSRLGALAVGLGLSAFLYKHLFVLGYIVAYYGFVAADVMVRPAYDTAANRDLFQRKWAQFNQILSLVLFGAAPFERTYIYGSEPAWWFGAAGLAIALAGLSISLMARMQLGTFGTPHLAVQEQQHVVRSGLYRRIRHPLYSGGLLTSLAWPIIFAAPATFIATAILRVVFIRRRIRVEESMMLERFGADYTTYMRDTYRLIPGVW